MDNLVTGFLSALVFIAFVAGLANSIAEPPFMLIVAVVVVMMLIDFVQSVKKDLAERRNSGSN